MDERLVMPLQHNFTDYESNLGGVIAKRENRIEYIINMADTEPAK